MKKTIIFLTMFLITSNAFGHVVLNSKINFSSENDSIIKVQIEGQEKILKILEGINRGNIQTRSAILNRINLENNYEDKIISDINEFKEILNSNNDTLAQAIKSGFDILQEKPKETNCNICAILGSILGALLSGGFAIIIFVQGKKNERKRENQKLIYYGEEIYTLIKNIVVNSKKQSELLNDLIASIREKAYTHGNYQHISFNLLQRAQSFDTTFTFNTFKQLNLEKKSYIKFYSSIDFLLEVFTNVDNDYHKNNSELITPLSNDFIKLKQEIFTQGTNYIELQRREEKTDDPLYQYLNKLIMDYYGSPSLPETIDIKYDVEMLIRPLKIELLEHFRDYDIANDILNLAKQAGDIYATITQENIKFANALAGQIESINNMIGQLEQIENELKTKYPN